MRRRASISSIVWPLRLQLMRAGKTVTGPLSVSMVHASPVTSRKERGGIKTSSSPGNSERNESGAPRSIEPTSNSNRIGRPFAALM